MKVIIRASDMGISEAYNEGALKAIDEGIVTTVEVMLDMQGSENALCEMKKRPWVTLNWHPRFMGKPAEADADVLKARLREEVETCIRLYGQAPFAVTLKDAGDAAEIVREVAEAYGIITHYYKDCGLHDYDGLGKAGLSFNDYRAYDPMSELKAMPESDGVTVCTFYPGFLDAYSLRLLLKDGDSERNIHRIQDVVVLCSDEIKSWVAERGIELVSLRDVVWGKCDYQNKLVCDGRPYAVPAKQ